MIAGFSDSQDLLARARAGDGEAFCELCRAYEAGLVRQATALSGSFSQGEDLAQETLVEAWKCLHRYNGRCQFFTWLCAILLNRYRNSMRRNRFWSWFSLSSSDEHGAESGLAVDSSPRPDQAAEFQEQAELIRKCVRSLPPKHQHVIYLRFYVDDSLEGIAEALGCSVGTVKSRLFNALDKLRAMKEISAQSAIYKTKAGCL